MNCTRSTAISNVLSSLLRVAVVPLLSLLVSCVPTPTGSDTQAPFQPGGIYVLCEGLWQQNNATMPYINIDGSIATDIVRSVNGRGLADTPTDMVVVGDTIYVVESTSGRITMIDALTARVLMSRVIARGRQPYRMTVSGGKLVSTCLNDDSIMEVDRRTLDVITERVTVGPAPEGIVVVGSHIYVANSGLGDLRKSEEGAGTISVLSSVDLGHVATLADVPNVGALAGDGQRRLVWACYRNLATRPDSLGGVVLIDASTNKVVRSWKLNSPTSVVVDTATGHAYVLHGHGVERLLADGTARRIIHHTSGGSNDVWYSLSIDPQQRRLMIGNARQFVTNGELLIATFDGDVLARYSVGLNPTRALRVTP